jgi:hypothetical protein
MRYVLMAVLILFPLLCGPGCQPTSPPAVEENAVLMTVAGGKLREDEFRRSYRVFRAAYGAEADEAPAEERSSKIRFIHQLADQMVLMAYARDSGVEMSDEGLQQALDALRENYPDGLFDQMLLENAINFEDWKEALRVRLTIDGLVEKDLAAKVRITEKDLAAYYQQQAPGQPVVEGEGGDQLDQLLVQQLRRQKTEQAYGPWLEDLRIRYPVAIDQAVVQKIISDSGVPAGDGGRNAP